MHDDQIYFHKQILIDSLEGFPMHMLTVTGNNGYSDEHSKPDEIYEPNDVMYTTCSDEDNESRPLNFDKKTIFITSRVHCGETQASFFLQGMFDFISAYGP